MDSLRLYEQEDFTPREYQVELFQAALRENIIVYLPTGAGKTFIAAMLIREKHVEVTKSLTQGGKRTVFLVPTVALAIQQAAYLKRHTHLVVKEFYGNMGVDMWQRERWNEEFEANHVLVMTAQVFVDVINHAFFSINQLNLLVFDECHAAVKDSPMRQILLKLHNSGNERPKVLGLTAALFRLRCKPSKVRDVIQQLEDSMNCVVKFPSNMDTVFRSSTKPCELIIQYKDNHTTSNDDVEHLTNTILSIVGSLVEHLRKTYGEAINNDSNVMRHLDNVDLLRDATKDIEYLLRTFGPYGAFHCVTVYSRILNEAQKHVKTSSFLVDLKKFIKHCDDIRTLCLECFTKYSGKECLLLFVQPKILRLLEVIRKCNDDTNVDEFQRKANKLSGLVFVERRCMANVLYHYLKEIREHDSTLGFLKPLFTMGQSSNRSGLRETQILEMKQREILRKFRDGSCNLLIATSVLEEGIDIPACNLIIRFDRMKTYCDYVQTKGRARSKKAFFCLLVSSSETESCVEDLAQFHAIEQQLSSSEGLEDERDDLLDKLFSQFIEPYAPFGDSGPQITLQSSISLVNRYCSKLSSRDVLLVPSWKIDTIDESAVNPDSLMKIRELMRKISTNDKSPRKNNYSTVTSQQTYFRCNLMLPLSSPLREEVVGSVMPTKRLAKRAAALKACIALHQLQELDDAHFFPVTRLKMDETDSELSEDEDLGQPNKRKGAYHRRIPSCLTNCRPLAEKPAFLYLIEFQLVKPCVDTTKLFFPSTVETKLAILTSQIIPTICPFPLLTRTGEILVNIKGVDSVVLTEGQIANLEKFHRFIFQDVIFLWRREIEFDETRSKMKYLIVPIRSDTHKIDFTFVECMINHSPISWEEKPYPSGNFNFQQTTFSDAVVVPFYKPFGIFNAFYVDIVSDLTVRSPFPETTFVSYASYFYLKYNLSLSDLDQRLIQVSREISGKNFLIPRDESTSEETSTHLIPEFCHVHPLPASVWKQVVWIPSVLHRLNGMLIAEELRLRIFQEAKIGIDYLPSDVNPVEIWRPLQMFSRKAFKTLNPLKRDPRLLLHSLKATSFQDDLELDKKLIWNLKYNTQVDQQSSSNASPNLDISSSGSEVKKGNSSKSFGKLALRDVESSRVVVEPSNSIDKHKTEWQELACINSLELQGSLNLKMKNMSFDEPNPGSLSIFGPSPGLILEALTIANTDEGFDMERLETIGDSILKLITTIYVYGETTNERSNEGRLSEMRTKQINNKHLFRIGVKNGIPEFMVAHRFDIVSFLPPGAVMPVSPESDNNPYTEQSILTKNVADCMEALIGVYLVCTGIKGAIGIMNWMELKTVPNTDTQSVNPRNGCPILISSVEFPSFISRSNEEDQWLNLYSGLDSFQQRLHYNFKNKALLIEAMTHPSYISNRLTNCYQRLEFLGDAVLDYLVTRYYYDCPNQYNPAMLTDLRTAIVNNETFAVIAVRNRFHLYLKHLSLSLNADLDRFIRAQEENGHPYMHNYYILEEDNPNEPLARNVDVPKVLGDIFESVAGAIFIDSGMSLDAVWKSYLPFLQDALERFGEVTPVSALRELYERFPNNTNSSFRKLENLSDGRFCVAFEVDKVTVFKGAGNSLKSAKSAAAKYALNQLSKNS